MKDFPVFTTEYGVASLILREIPYRQEAYIHIRSSLQPKQLLEECVSFCRAVGAEKVYARGHEILESYPLHTAIIQMRGTAQPDPEQVACLWPVTEDTVGRWRELMNRRMAGVDNAGTLEARGEGEILTSGGAYFVHRAGKLLGLGWLRGDEIALVAATEPGMGATVMHTLMSLVPGESLSLDVASTNLRAIRLYERLGFCQVSEQRRWYRVHP